MKNYVQYHNTEKMGYAALEAASGYFQISTNKPTQEVVGNRIWLFAGKGKPRRYFLAFVFIAENFSTVSEQDFFYQVRGREGKVFDPSLEVTHYPWFRELLRSQGNFAFGLNILDERYIPYLEKLLEQ
jgi:hypothetical protein